MALALRVSLTCFASCIASSVDVASLSVHQEVLEQDDACMTGDSSDCSITLLQRRAVPKKPEGRIRGDHKSDHDHHDHHYVTLADPAYISLLQGVTTSSGISLYDSVKDKSWPPSLLLGQQSATWTQNYEYDFPNTALFLWGSNASDKLFVFAGGTNSLCMQYAPTLHHIAKHLGYFVVCPQFSNGPSSQESVMKPVCAVEWALANVGNFSVVALGGHSGGGSAVPATANVLLSKNIRVDAMVLWHPGVVSNMNVPGCYSSCGGSGCFSSTAVSCKEYFPEDLMARVASVKMLILAGNFCEWTKVQNSAWLSNYGCCYGCSSNPPITTCPTMTFDTPSFRPQQPAYTCDTGCPDFSFLANPGDCMVETFSGTIKDTYFTNFTGEAFFVDTCGEHDYATMLHTGLHQEGKPFLSPFLRAVGGDTPALQHLLDKNGKSATCRASYNIHDMCLFLDSPYSDRTNPFYTAADGSTQSCADAHENHATGTLTIISKGT